LRVRNTLTTVDLPYFSPGQLRAHIETARKAGLLDEGPGWTLKGAAADKLALDMNRDLAHGKQLERYLKNRLIERSGRPS
jgi:hypothetical protein